MAKSEYDRNQQEKEQLRARVIVLRVNNPSYNTNTLDIAEIEDIIHLPQAIQLANAFQSAIVPTTSDFGENTLRFDVERGLGIATHVYPRAINVNYVTRTLSQNNNQVQSMINKVIEELKSLLGINLANSVLQQLTAVITETFTNLYVQQQSAWIFWGRQTSAQTNYSYNIVFAIQNSQTGSFMKAIPMGFEISAYIARERLLFFNIQDYASYSVKIHAIQVMQPLIHGSFQPLRGIFNIITSLNDRSSIQISEYYNEHIHDYPVKLWEYNNNINQKWILIFNQTNRAYSIQNLIARYLVLTWDSTPGSNKVFAATNRWNDSQFWILESTANGSVFLTNMKDTQVVLEIENSNTTNGTNVIVNRKNNTVNQKFFLNKINQEFRNGLYKIKTALNNSSALQMSEDYFGYTPDFYIKLWNENNDDINQKWILEFDSTSSAYQIKSQRNPSLLLAWAWSVPTVRIPNPNTDDHLWFLQSAGYGTYYFVNMTDTRYVLEVDNSSTANGTIITINKRNGNINQKFLLEIIN
ncbi:RICIN domain-containing protein [Bacillus cereus]|uniref:Toxin n=1 Tax=Bacillus thuringiensis subsp. medellin TaxID=79672 RepID=A0A9X6R9P8_BACTV|nr:RICIN domain-containing protein [Bacillus thuringiensis]MCU5409255.1 RICIN domain-containing protein [Bacillus cereus]OUB85937.1 toxin [Bacillus thuringiensis serovar medellin]